MLQLQYCLLIGISPHLRHECRPMYMLLKLCFLKVNKLSLNAKKSKCMIFKQVNKKTEPFSLKIENTNIERVTDFLGLTISDNLEWKNHVQKIANKCSRTIGILNKLKHILPANISLILYNSLVLPQFNFCILAWGHNCSSFKRKP